MQQLDVKRRHAVLEAEVLAQADINEQMVNIPVLFCMIQKLLICRLILRC